MGIGAGAAAAATAVGASAATASAASAAAVALTAAGAIASAASAIHGGLYQAQVAKNNSKIAGQSATYSTEAANTQAQNQSFKNAAVAGDLRASQAANGVDINTGSDTSVENSQEAVGDLDTQSTLHNAMLQAYGYQTQSADLAAQSKQDAAGGIESGVGSLLSNASGLAFKWSGGSGGAGIGDSLGNDGTDNAIVAHQGGV